MLIHLIKGVPMRQIHALFSLIILASLKLSIGATVTLKGADCIDTYIEATSPSKNFEGQDIILSQI